ncbi:MAG: thioredoxin 1 [Candidatus Dependentiae bacterium]|nr:thioredoxin 1 [Candidatus Dependentiae bacterium]
MVTKITSANFNAVVINADKPVIIDFFAEWCGPCRQMAPIFEELSKELANSYIFGKIDIEEDHDLGVNHGITSIPTLIFYKAGKQVGAVSGGLSKQEIKAKLATIFGQ